MFEMGRAIGVREGRKGQKKGVMVQLLTQGRESEDAAAGGAEHSPFDILEPTTMKWRGGTGERRSFWTTMNEGFF